MPPVERQANMTKGVRTEVTGQLYHNAGADERQCKYAAPAGVQPVLKYVMGVGTRVT